MAAAATGMYSSYKTGAGAPIPAGSGPGGIDINALIKGMVSRDIWTYYYKLKIPAGTTVLNQYSLFQYVNQQTDPYNSGSTLTYADTNMPSSASQGFSAPRDLVLDSIGFSFSQDTILADQVSFVKNSYMQFKILDKVFFEGPLTLFPSGTGITGYSTATSQQAWQIGMPMLSGRKRFGPFAKYLAPLMQWSLIIYFPGLSTSTFPSTLVPVMTSTVNGGNGLELRVDLNGLTDRPVQ